MINLSMWGFEPADGFGAATTDFIGEDPAAEGTGGVPKDLTFGAHLAESLFGIVEEGDDEEAVPDLPAAFLVTQPMREQEMLAQKMLAQEVPAEKMPVQESLAQERPAPAVPAHEMLAQETLAQEMLADEIPVRPSEIGDGQEAVRAEGDVPAETPDVLLKAGLYKAMRTDAPASEAAPPEADRRATELPRPQRTDTEAHAAAVEVPPGPRGTSAKEAEAGVEPRPEEERAAEARRVEPRAEPAAFVPKRAPERRIEKGDPAPVAQMDAIQDRDVAPGRRIEATMPLKDGPSSPAMAPREAPSSESQERQSGEQQERRLPDQRAVEVPREPLVEFVRPSAEPHAPRVVAPEPAAQTLAEAAPRTVVLHTSAPMQPEVTGGEFEIASAPPETRGPLPRETSESIVQSLRMQYQRGGGDAVVHIKPEHLGPVSVSLRVENGSVSAVVNAENPAVAEWLKANEHLLRDGLAASGLHLERFAIKRDGQSPEDGRKGWRAPDDRARRRRALEPESTFEITV